MTGANRDTGGERVEEVTGQRELQPLAPCIIPGDHRPGGERHLPSARFFWTTSLAQVYPDLARLEERGFVTRREDLRGARPRSFYEVTKKGEEALLHWLSSDREQPPQYRDEGVLRLFFADALTHEQQRSLVRRLAERARRGEQQIREEIVPIAETMAANQGPRFPAITARLGADLFGFAADWMEELERELATRSSS